jgi:hypothetical protein
MIALIKLLVCLQKFLSFCMNEELEKIIKDKNLKIYYKFDGLFLEDLINPLINFPISKFFDIFLDG